MKTRSSECVHHLPGTRAPRHLLYRCFPPSPLSTASTNTAMLPWTPIHSVSQTNLSSAFTLRNSETRQPFTEQANLVRRTLLHLEHSRTRFCFRYQGCEEVRPRMTCAPPQQARAVKEREEQRGKRRHGACKTKILEKKRVNEGSDKSGGRTRRRKKKRKIRRPCCLAESGYTNTETRIYHSTPPQQPSLCLRWKSVGIQLKATR